MIFHKTALIDQNPTLPSLKISHFTQRKAEVFTVVCSTLLQGSVLFSSLELLFPLSSQSSIVMGLSGRAKCYYFSHPLSWNWDSLLFPHEFLILPESPLPFLETDILGKVQASVFMNMESELSLPLIEQM